MNPNRREPIRGDESYRQRSLEVARRQAQELADKFQKDVGIFRTEEGTALFRELKFIPDSIAVEEIIKPSQPDLPVCPSCKERAKSATELCKKCQRKTRR